MIPLEKLTALKIFQNSPKDVLERLSEELDEKSFNKGDIVFEEGGTSNSLHLIAEGSVTVEKIISKKSQKSKVVARLEAEEFFGEMAFLENQPHSATIIAQEPTRVFILEKKVLDGITKTDPQRAVKQVATLFQSVSSRLRATTNELVSVFEVARAVSQSPSMADLMSTLLTQFEFAISSDLSMAFYRWNPFNEEYNIQLNNADGDFFPDVIEGIEPLVKSDHGLVRNYKDISMENPALSPLKIKSGHLIVSLCENDEGKEGALLMYLKKPNSFTSGHRQLIETISAVLVPALIGLRGREEEEAKKRLEQSRQQTSGL